MADAPSAPATAHDPNRPPLLRVDDGGTGIHIPIGHHVLRWWMMPLFVGDDVPGIHAWVEDQFGSEE